MLPSTAQGGALNIQAPRSPARPSSKASPPSPGRSFLDCCSRPGKGRLSEALSDGRDTASSRSLSDRARSWPGRGALSSHSLAVGPGLSRDVDLAWTTRGPSRFHYEYSHPISPVVGRRHNYGCHLIYECLAKHCLLEIIISSPCISTCAVVETSADIALGVYGLPRAQT